MTYYIGNEQNLDALIGDGNKRYFYGLRRDEQGTLYFVRIDQIKDDNIIAVNDPGLAQNDFQDFEYGVDYFDGRLAEDHSRPHSNLHWDQYRWDNKSIYYYINDAGEFVAVVNRPHTYPDGTQID